MKILIDIYHLAHLNFFKHALAILDQNHDLEVFTFNRGKLADVVKKECPGLSITVYGDFSKNKGRVSFIFRVVLPRLYALWKRIRKEKFDLVMTANYQSNVAARLCGIYNLGFNDDPEKINLKILKLFGHEVYLPVFGTPGGKVKVFNALKEWAYLSPRYFQPDPAALEPYKLIARNYIFVREVSNKSMNYLSQDAGTVLSFASQLPKDLPVVLSLEDKNLKDLYPPHWIILEEPVADIHSLIYYSKLMIASGDSMAREGAMLGVPGIYCGNRDMAANRVLIEKGMVLKTPPAHVAPLVKQIIDGTIEPPVPQQDTFRAALDEEWEDITQLILSIAQRCEKRSTK